jgi:hypothetical protein
LTDDDDGVILDRIDVFEASFSKVDWRLIDDELGFGSVDVFVFEGL